MQVLLHGEVRKLEMRLENAGRAPLRALHLCLSHPDFFAVAKVVDGAVAEEYSRPDAVCDTVGTCKTERVTHTGGQSEVPSCRTFTAAEQCVSQKQKVPEGQEHSPIIPLPSIEPGGSVVVPIWLRGSHIGMHTVNSCCVISELIMAVAGGHAVLL